MTPDLKRRLDPRPGPRTVDNGRVVEIFNGDAEFREVLGVLGQVTQVTLQPGGRAGNHVHRRKREILYLVSGRLRGVFHDPASGERLTLELPAGVKINLLPGIEHAFVNDGEEKAVVLEFANLPYVPSDPDATPVKLI